MRIALAPTIAVALFAFIGSQGAALEPVTRTVDLPGAPLEITSYTAVYQEGGRYTTEGIRHVVNYRNRGNKAIVALQLGLVSFNVFNEFIGRTNGVDISEVDMGEAKQGQWVDRAYGDFAFLTGVAYVSKVRFSDGEVWEADLAQVAQELSKLERDFDVARLKAQPAKDM